MKTKLTLLLLPLFVLLLSSSCNKDDDNNNTQQTVSNPTPNFDDGEGYFIAVQSQSSQETPIGSIDVDIDAAVAAVSDGGNTYNDVGTTSLNNNDLEKLSNNSYVLPGTNVTSADLDFGVSTGTINSWTVAGNGSFAAFNYSTSKVTPSQIKLSGDYSSVNTSNNLVLSLTSSPLYADSVLFILSANNESVSKTVASYVSTVTFTASELSSLSGTGVVQAAAYNFESSVINGKKLYFINESVVSETTDFQ